MIILNRSNQESEPSHEPTLPGLSLHKRCLHKDIYDLGDSLLIVANDRMLHPDTYLVETVPGKNTLAIKQSRYWFDVLSDLCPSHFISTNADDFPDSCSRHIKQLQGRSMLVKKMIPLPTRYLVLGYLKGAAWLEYRETGMVAGNTLPSDLQEAQRLPAPICIPMIDTSLDGASHDQSDKFVSEPLSDLARDLYFKAWKLARSRDVLLVSTIFRFGLYEDQVHLIGECITPDSSRFASLAADKPRGTLPSCGKDILFHDDGGFCGENMMQNNRIKSLHGLYLKLTGGHCLVKRIKSPAG